MEMTRKMSGGFSGLPVFLFIFGVIGVFFGYNIATQEFSNQKNYSVVVSTWVDLTPLQIELVNKHGNHSYVRHGIEANLALKCLQENGSSKSFDTFPDENPEFNSTTFLCNFPKQLNTNYAIVLKKMSNGTWELITAYKVSKEIFPNLSNYIGYLYEYWNASTSSTVIKSGEIIYNFALK